MDVTGKGIHFEKVEESPVSSDSLILPVDISSFINEFTTKQLIEKSTSNNETINLIEPVEKKVKLQSEVLPEISRIPQERGHSKKYGKCFCTPMAVEEEWNLEEPSTFINKYKHREFNGQRAHVKPDDCLLRAEFLIGKEMSVKICLLRDEVLEIDNRIIIVLHQGENEIRLPAVRFLKHTFTKISNGIMFKCSYEGTSTLEEELCKGAVYADYFKDSFAKWVILRQYIHDYVSERMYISSTTWVEFKMLTPLFSSCVDYYINLVLQGRISDCRENNCVYSTPSSPKHICNL